MSLQVSPILPVYLFYSHGKLLHLHLMLQSSFIYAKLKIRCVHKSILFYAMKGIKSIPNVC